LKENDQNLLNMKNEFEREKSEYHQKVEEYERLYIEPEQIMARFRPYNYFLFKYGKELKERNEIFKIANGAAKWRELSEADKGKIKEESFNEKFKHLDIYN
jgi:hypothetical protein